MKSNNHTSHLQRPGRQEKKKKKMFQHVSDSLHKGKDFKVSHNSAVHNKMNLKFTSKIRIYFTLKFGIQ